MPITSVSTSNTFNEWRITTNSLVTEVNKIEDGTATLNVNTLTANVITTNVSSTNISSSNTLNVANVATFSSDSRFVSTGAVLISKGTTAQRNYSPEVGMLRYNTTIGEFEGYSGASPSWKSVGGSAITNDISTASDLFPAFLSDTTNTALNIFTSNSKLLYKPSTGELKADHLVAQNGMFINSTIIDANYTISTNTNAFSVGPITVANNTTISISSGQRWIVI
jgi:hypothetical protein